MWPGPSRSGEPSRTTHVAECLQHSDASFRHGESSIGETRLRAITALAWEFWAFNRRGWQIVLAATASCALLYRAFAPALQQSEGLQFLCCLPMVMSLILAGAFCNFTDRERRDGIAGFPRHLFVLPFKTSLLVTCAMACGLLSVLSVYVAWATIVLPPTGVEIWVRWPATLFAVCVVLFQSMIWCLCGFRITRIVALSLIATTVVGIGFLPVLLPKTNLWSSQAVLTTALAGIAAAAYAATLITVGVQRRGGGRGWTGILRFVECAVAAVPYRSKALNSPDAALFWIEWRRSGLVLPTSVLLTTVLILMLTIQFTDRDAQATLWTETWLMLMPIVLAVPIGMGFGKPDFWSLELSLPTFIAARPVSGGQLLAAKLKAAALSTLLAWGALLLVAPLCIYQYLDTEHWHDMWHMCGILFSGFSLWTLPFFALFAAIVLTWSLLIGNIWLGHSGRPGHYYSLVAVGMAGLLASLSFLVWWADNPSSRERLVANILPVLPWLLAVALTVKVWTAAACAHRLQLRRLISRRHIAIFICAWLAATSCLVIRAWHLSPRVEWLRSSLLLTALCVIPAARLAAAPLTIAWNRHR